MYRMIHEHLVFVVYGHEIRHCTHFDELDCMRISHRIIYGLFVVVDHDI